MWRSDSGEHEIERRDDRITVIGQVRDRLSQQAAVDGEKLVRGEPEFAALDRHDRIEAICAGELLARRQRRHDRRVQARDQIGLKNDEIRPVRRVFSLASLSDTSENIA